MSERNIEMQVKYNNDMVTAYPVTKMAYLKDTAFGTVTLFNKYVVSGCVLSKTANARTLTLSKTGTLVNGNVSRFYADGTDHYIGDQVFSGVTVPKNNGSAPVTYYACLKLDTATGLYGLYLTTSATEAESLVKLYTVTVPAADTADNLNGCTLTSIRRIEENADYQYSAPSSVSVSLPRTISSVSGATTLKIQTKVVSASPMQGVGEVVISDIASDGFTVSTTGTADNVVIDFEVIYA